MIKQISHTSITPTIRNTLKNISSTATESVPKKITGQDILFFRQYIFSKGLELKTTQEEIQQLFKLEGEEFFNSAFEFLFKKLGIPECLKPQILEIPMAESIGMAYNYAQNLLIRNSNAPKATKVETYSYIRHELQHMVQNFEMFRHKTLAEKLIPFYAETLTNTQIPIVDNNARNVSLEELKKFGVPQEWLVFYKKLKDLLKDNNEKEYKKTLESYRTELFNANIEEYKNFRNIVIKEMGELKEGSRAERRAEKFYNNMVNSNIDITSGNIHAGEYNYDIRENEAIIAGEVAYNDASCHLGKKETCYISRIKLKSQEAVENMQKDEKVSKEMMEKTEELKKQNLFSSSKDFADYLFD